MHSEACWVGAAAQHSKTEWQKQRHFDTSPEMLTKEGLAFFPPIPKTLPLNLTSRPRAVTVILPTTIQMGTVSAWSFLCIGCDGKSISLFDFCALAVTEN